MQSDLFAYEAGAWDYDSNHVWFTSSVLTHPTYISILDSNTNNITKLNIPTLVNISLNGGYYFNGKMYFTVAGDESVPNAAAGVYAIHTKTYQATLVLDSFYGLRYQSVDELS